MVVAGKEIVVERGRFEIEKIIIEAMTLCKCDVKTVAQEFKKMDNIPHRF